MPVLVSGLDDEIIRDETPVFSGGQYSNARASNLDPNNFWLGENCDLSLIGRLTTRRGTIGVGTQFAYPIQGIGYLSTASSKQLITVVRDGSGYSRLKYWDGTTWNDPTSPANYSLVLPVQMNQGGDKLWVTQLGRVLSYWDGTYNVNLTEVGPAFNEWHTNRLVLSGYPTKPNTLVFSQYLDGTVYNHTYWDMDIGSGDGDPITGIRSWTNSNLVVFKEHSVWVVNCDPKLLTGDVNGSVNNFIVNPVHRRIGSISPNTAVQVGADIFFLSDSGVRSISRTLASESQSQVGPALSEPITDLIERINPAGLVNSCAYYWKNRYILSVPLDGATYPNYTLVYNTLTQSWSGYWSGISPTCYTRRIVGTTPRLVFGQSNGKITDFRDYTPESSEVTADYQDDGATNYPTTIVSRAFTCGDQDSPKTGLFTRLEFKQSTGTATVSAILGITNTEDVLDTFPTSNSTLTLPLTLPFNLPSGGFLPKSLDLMKLGQWREIQIKVASTSGKISLNKISVGAFLDAYIFQQ